MPCSCSIMNLIFVIRIIFSITVSYVIGFNCNSLDSFRRGPSWFLHGISIFINGFFVHVIIFIDYCCRFGWKATITILDWSTRKLKSPKWEIDHTETYFHQSKNPRMEGLVIMNCFVWHSRFFDLSLFGGFKNFRDVGTSRWAILPPSDLLSFIDFLFHHSQIYLFQFNEILSMNLK